MHQDGMATFGKANATDIAMNHPFTVTYFTDLLPLPLPLPFPVPVPLPLSLLLPLPLPLPLPLMPQCPTPTHTSVHMPTFTNLFKTVRHAMHSDIAGAAPPTFSRAGPNWPRTLFWRPLARTQGSSSASLPPSLSHCAWPPSKSGQTTRLGTW